MVGENTAQNAAVEVAAFSVSRALGGGVRGGVAGLVVQPVVWAVTGNGPDAADAFIYLTGAAGAVAGALVAIPALFTGAIKAVMDDHNEQRLVEARADEPTAVRGGVTRADDFSFAANMNHTQAMVIAQAGGVCWRHRNGVYLYLKDAAGLPVCDYQPRSWTAIYRPLIPLQMNGGAVRYEVRRQH